MIGLRRVYHVMNSIGNDTCTDATTGRRDQPRRLRGDAKWLSLRPRVDERHKSATYTVVRDVSNLLSYGPRDGRDVIVYARCRRRDM